MAAIRAAARQRWPSAYARARNSVSLAQWILGRGRSAAADPYDDAFWDFHAGGDWDGMADLLVRYARPRSLVDVGCGQGLLLAGLRRTHPEIPVKGIDSSVHAVARARSRELDVAFADLASTRPAARRKAKELLAGSEVAVCLETAEHLPPWAASPLVELLAGARRIIFSAAHPGQGGTMHLNEQPFEYWLARFRRRGFDLDPLDAAFRADVAGLDLPWWYGANIHLLSAAADRPSRGSA